jgi:hypothetical protein
MFYYIALKYGNFLLETLDTFPLLKDAYTQSRKLYENQISSIASDAYGIGFVEETRTTRDQYCGCIETV